MQTVEDAMTVDVITVGPDEPVTVAARIMRNAGATGLLVVDASGYLAGILTEADLLNPAAADLSEINDQRGSRNTAPAGSDADIEAEIRSRVIGEVLGLDRDHVDISVDQGVVTLAGVVTKRQEAIRLQRLASKVLGVSRVKTSVTLEADTAYLGLVPRFAYFANDIAKRREEPRG